MLEELAKVNKKETMRKSILFKETSTTSFSRKIKAFCVGMENSRKNIKRASATGSEEDVGERSYFLDQSSISRVSQQYLLSREKGWERSPCHKFEESQSVHSIPTFQNTRHVLPQKTFSEMGFNVQTGHEGSCAYALG